MEALLLHGGNGDAVFALKLLIGSLFLHEHALREKVLRFIFEVSLPFKGKVSLESFGSLCDYHASSGKSMVLFPPDRMDEAR